MIIKLTKLITNQLIIGDTTRSGKTIIENPYMVIPGPEGIQIFPFDEAIIGKPLEIMEIPQDSILYTTEVGDDLKNAYLQAVTGIETQNKKLILG